MFKIIATLVTVAFVGTVSSVGFAFNQYGDDLPDHEELANYQPDVTTRVLAADGRLMAEYATEKRTYVPIDAIPDLVKFAFLSAEDKTFYDHFGLDMLGLARAVVTNIQNLNSGRRPVGASTITQQVAKNFLLTNEVSVERKIKEAILALRIEQTFEKDYILELYLNQIFLGFRSYGVATAAMNYFAKSLDELTIAEAAFLAALPKAPNNYHPVRKLEAAIGRRNWVLDRMVEDKRITPFQAETAKLEPITLRKRDEAQMADNAGFYAEEVRRFLQRSYGEDALYKGGLYVRTTMDPRLQTIATQALQNGLIAYDQRHGYRGPVSTVATLENWRTELPAVTAPDGMLDRWELGVVLQVTGDGAGIGLTDGSGGTIPFSEMSWARPWLPDQRFGASPKRPSDVLSVGDVIVVESLSTDEDGNALPAGTFALRQMPDIEGALVSMDPQTGRVLAMVGGFSPERSDFNRATQALRQPGSAFKPFVYLAALDNGYTPATIIMDAPFVYDPGPGQELWRPKNYSGEFYGPSTLRLGMEKSRNLMTVRLANAVGMDKITAYAENFGIVEEMDPFLAASLGSVETTVLDLTSAYAMIVNGGRRITPTFIDRIQDRFGETVYRHDTRNCPDCEAVRFEGQTPPRMPDNRDVMADPQSAYQMVSILKGVVDRGTGARVRAVGKTVAGKTGTSNDAFDTWFVGFSPDLVTGVFVGFDRPRTLGAREAGSTAAAPIFTAFMKDALENTPDRPFQAPPGIRFVNVERTSGARASAGSEAVIEEAFKPGTEPTYQPQIAIDGSAVPYDPSTGFFSSQPSIEPGAATLPAPVGINSFGDAPSAGGVY